MFLVSENATPLHHHQFDRGYLMITEKTTTKDKVALFWGKYLSFLKERGVKEKAARWYVRRAEEFIRSAKGKKLQEQSAADINRYLE